MTLERGTGRSHRHESLIGAELAHADFGAAILEHVVFTGADLSGARFDDAILRHCDLSGANLSGARLCGVTAAFTELRAADISRADLRRSSWTACDLQDAQLPEAKLDGGAFAGCRFDRADLSRASLFKTNTIHSVFAEARFDDARKFAWSREIVVELLSREAKSVDELRYVGAIALRQDWCYEEWRAVTADAPEYRRRALDVMAQWPESGFAAAFGGVDE